MASPKPDPPYLEVVVSSSWLNGSKIFGRYSLFMPMPVSFTVNRKLDCPSYCAVHSISNEISPPVSVNLTALLRIFIKICSSLVSSPI